MDAIIGLIGIVLTVVSAKKLPAGGWLWPALLTFGIVMIILGSFPFTEGFWQGIDEASKQRVS